MSKLLFISPHLDDAVFSCAARILKETRAGVQVTVATVFSHARPRSALSREYAARRDEDCKALRLLGAEQMWLGLLDAPCRNPFYSSFRRIVLETAPDDCDQVLVVRAELTRLLNELTPDAIYLPLAVGGHIDHRLVFAAGWTLPTTCPCYLYEDQPYAQVRFSVPMRLQEIEAAPCKREGRSAAAPRSNAQKLSFLRSFRAAPYVRQYLPAGKERRICEALLWQKLSTLAKPEIWMKSEAEAARAGDQSRILSALYAYRSQARSFLGSRGQFVAACKSHARWLGLKCWRVERFWKPLACTSDRV